MKNHILFIAVYCLFFSSCSNTIENIPDAIISITYTNGSSFIPFVDTLTVTNTSIHYRGGYFSMLPKKQDTTISVSWALEQIMAGHTVSQVWSAEGNTPSPNNSDPANYSLEIKGSDNQTKYIRFSDSKKTGLMVMLSRIDSLCSKYRGKP